MNKGLIFIHIPKTGGRCLDNVLAEQYTGKGSYMVYEQEFYQPPESLIRSLQRDKPKLIYGHMPYGTHLFLDYDTTYVTMMRNPMDRIRSHYGGHLDQNPTICPHCNKDFIGGVGLFKEFAALEPMKNTMTKYIWGGAVIRNDQDPMPIVKERLEKQFSVVGLTEYFDESIHLMKKELGWKKPITPYRTNEIVPGYRVVGRSFQEFVTKKRIQDYEILPETWDYVRKHNKYDFELFEWAKGRLETTLRDQSQEFKNDLEEFRRGNHAEVRVTGEVNQ